MSGNCLCIWEKAWCPEHRKENEWILVDLGVQSEVAGVMTQGRDKKGSQSWVTHYHVSYSEDAYRWDWARDIYGDKKLLSGNTDSHTVKGKISEAACPGLA